MTTQQQIDAVYQTYQDAQRLYYQGKISLAELDNAFADYYHDLEKLGPVNEDEDYDEDFEAFMQENGGDYKAAGDLIDRVLAEQRRAAKREWRMT